MTNRELRKLSRAELLELLIEQGRENLALQEQLQAATAELDSRNIKIENCGSIAEAALQLNGVFEAAQRATDQYRAECEKQCAAMIAAAEEEAKAIRENAVRNGEKGARQK